MIKMRNRNIIPHKTQTWGIQRHPFFSGTQMMTEVTTQTRDNNTKNGLGKTTNFYFTAILGANIHKEGIGKNIRNLRRMLQKTSQKFADQVRTIIKKG